MQFSSQEQEKKIIKLVDKILDTEESKSDAKTLEKEINQLVYKLYELTAEEQN